ncbi:MAG: helix-turn-helix domain-containing protein [Bryobacteraceae bacterium]
MDNQTIERQTLPLMEAGRLLGVGRNTTYLAAKTGQIPTVLIGKRLFVPRLALERLLAGQRGI